MRYWHPSAAALSLMLLVSSSVSAAPPIGTTVKATTTVSANGRTLRPSSPLFLNDVLRSNATGVGQFVFDDGTKLAMGPSASLTIDKSIYKGSSVQRTSIQASRGAFRFISGKLSGKKIATPYGTIGIRGTAFDFTIRDGRLYLLLYRGAVDFCGGGKCKTVSRSCDYIVAGGGRISDPQPLGNGVNSGLNVGRVFPLAVNQGQLGSQFRQAGKKCMTRLALRTKEIRTLGLPSVPSTSEPGPAPGPGPDPAPGKGNKGFGNGGETDDSGSPTESRNPGQGHGYGRTK
jgi:hypothetical protein